MKKHVLAMVVTAMMAGGAATAAQADSTTVSGGTVNFVGQVVDAACAVSADSTDQTVTLSQVRTAKLTTAGMTANQKEAFSIKLADCDTTVSQNAAVIFNGQQDSIQVGALANTAGAGSATNVALQLYGPDGQTLNVGDTSAAIVLVDGSNTLPLSVDYIATGAATAGNVAATATFNMVYS
ncbi:fimbrial protein BcfA [[Enterobacter] lignolyticus]|uniref:Fimbrial protein domain-containing protein n=2 Tax=[Enterobacter] lignolyticus TaxID=1334193 RepID=E3G2G6_ENTLS|nr:fimbrial protein BcfA [[Enterobacter] lignolyticus]ADO46905.1 Fimbrial protein domain-containing protein [[Enterobacter] lignolyticus SCF1]ALR78157.1 fimbrial protein [[Enterobacter] lignolyticus]